jgi:alkylation response protein AidB-like acyl-CoA dehydrogenase
MKIPVFDDLIYSFVKSKLPEISETEMEALDSGTDDNGWVAEIMKGRPDWEKLFELTKPALTEEEQSFLDNEVEELCEMLDVWKINEETKELPEDALQYIKDKGFFGMVVPKEYGGLGFSALGHSAVVLKLASRSGAASVTVMVPNSLGPAELLHHYGTDEQKEKYLPDLASGAKIPCFGLTELTAGSDAGAIKAKGIVTKGEDGRLKVKLDFEKRYITLAPMADLVGLAFKLEDPDGLLPEGVLREDNPNITACLIDVDDEDGNRVSGLDIGSRHDPSGVRFLNGMVIGEGVEIDLEDGIIGGYEGVGWGWKMLMESLGVGRSISLPSSSEGATKLANYLTTSRPRRQFNVDTRKYIAAERLQAQMLGTMFLMNAQREGTLAMVDQRDEKPTVPSAYAKVHSTEDNAENITQGSRLWAGKSIMRGPHNPFDELLRAKEIGITVEGANIMTSALIMGGQAIVRTHPYLLPTTMAAQEGDKAKVRSLVLKHVASAAYNFTLNSWHRLTGGFTRRSPVNDNKMSKYYKQVNRLSTQFNIVADASFVLLGGALKREEGVAQRLGFVGSNLTRASLALWMYEKMGRPEELKYVAEYAVQHALAEAEENLHELMDNYPKKIKLLGPFLKATILGGRQNKKPSDDLAHKVVEKFLNPGEARDFMTDGIFISDNDNDAVGQVRYTYDLEQDAKPVIEKLKAAKIRPHEGNVLNETVLSQAVDNEVISAEEADTLIRYEHALNEINRVDTYDRELNELVRSPQPKM